MQVSSEVPTNILIWLAIMSLTLLPFITKSKMRVINYNPQHMIRQLSYDQLAIQITGEVGYSDTLTTESQFVGEGKKDIAVKFDSIYWLNKTRVGVTLGGCIY